VSPFHNVNITWYVQLPETQVELAPSHHILTVSISSGDHGILLETLAIPFHATVPTTSGEHSVLLKSSDTMFCLPLYITSKGLHSPRKFLVKVMPLLGSCLGRAIVQYFAIVEVVYRRPYKHNLGLTYSGAHLADVVDLWPVVYICFMVRWSWCWSEWLR